jgi:hypothetical protein
MRPNMHRNAVRVRALSRIRPCATPKIAVPETARKTGVHPASRIRERGFRHRRAQRAGTARALPVRRKTLK